MIRVREAGGVEFGSNDVQALGSYSMASGAGVKAQAEGSLAIGQYNDPDNDKGVNYLFSAGNGNSDSTRSNAFALTKEGDAYFAGKIYYNNIEIDMSKIPTIYLKTDAPTT